MTITNVTPPVTDEPPPEHLIDLDAVCAELHKMGHKAYVEMTGGGVATIYAGEKFIGPDGYDSYPTLGGPGWFTEPGYKRAFAQAGDFYIGPGDEDSQYVTIEVTDDHTPLGVARVMAVAITSHSTYPTTDQQTNEGD